METYSTEYHCDDYHLVVLIHGEDKPKPRPWYYLGTGIFFLGAAVLIGLAWYFDAH